jgi:hypothetical protein
MEELMMEGKKVLVEKHNLKLELLLTQQRIATLNGRNPDCSHGNLLEPVESLEQQLEARNWNKQKQPETWKLPRHS